MLAGGREDSRAGCSAVGSGQLDRVGAGWECSFWLDAVSPRESWSSSARFVRDSPEVSRAVGLSKPTMLPAGSSTEDASIRTGVPALAEEGTARAQRHSGRRGVQQPRRQRGAAGSLLDALVHGSEPQPAWSQVFEDGCRSLDG